MNAPLRAKLMALEGMADLVDASVYAATREYAAQGAGGATGGTGGGDGKNNVLRRFTKANTHGFAPLSPPYKAWKLRRFGAKPILVRTGMLREAVRRSGRVTLVGRGKALVVFNLPQHGRFHEEGTGKMPRRSPVQPNAEDRTAWKKRVAQIFRQMLRRTQARG